MVHGEGEVVDRVPELVPSEMARGGGAFADFGYGKLVGLFVRGAAVELGWRRGGCGGREEEVFGEVETRAGEPARDAVHAGRFVYHLPQSKLQPHWSCGVRGEQAESGEE